MRRRTNGPATSNTIALFLVALLAAFVPASAFAQDLSGTYRVTTDSTTVQIPEWGQDCGPRPASRTGTTGREATVTSDGSQLAIQDGRHRNRTDACWSENPHVRRISVSHSGSRWTVVCSTPDDDYQHEQGSYTIQVDGTRITMHESTDYSWQLRESRCRATASRTLAFERTADANTPPPNTTPDAGHTVTTPPPNNVASRCASPGAAVRLALSPSRRPLAAGQRACFRVRFMDAQNCEVTAGVPPVAWTMTRSGGTAGATDALMENGCVRAPTGSPVAEYTVSATSGPLTATAVASVVSAEELRSLVAQQFEDEDAGAPAIAPTTTASGAGMGAVVVQPPPAATPPQHGTGPVLWVLIGLGALLAVAGVTLLSGKKPRPAVSRISAPPDRISEPGARQRHETTPIPVKELRPPPRPIAQDTPAAAPLAVRDAVPPPSPPASESPPIGPSAAPPATAAPRPLVKRCPQCNDRFTAEIAFCPEHGTPLVPIDATSPEPSGGLPAASAPAATICATCGQSVELGAQFCPRDGTPIRTPGSGPAASHPMPSARPALPLVCPRCQRRFPENTLFCGEDGTALVHG